MSYDVAKILKNLDIQEENYGAFDGEWFGNGPILESVSPIDGKLIARVKQATAEDYEKVYKKAHEAFLSWRMVPAPKEERLFAK